jgi:release factor glutamine methyltransferase
MASVRELLRRADQLHGDSPRRDAEVLLGHCLRRNRSWLYSWPEAEVAAGDEEQFLHLLGERQRGMPVAYLTGRREFWSLPLKVNEHTLIPRPETETLVQWALELSLPAAAAVLDLGTGSGAIALALASERPKWGVTAVDRSVEALQVARDNGRQLGLSEVCWLRSDWYTGLAGARFDLLVSNPPYVEPGDPHLEAGDLRFEPPSALVAGAGGLADLASIVDGAGDHLHPGGWLLLEHGFGQGPAVRRLLVEAGFSEVATRQDIGGQDRVSGGRLDAE